MATQRLTGLAKTRTKLIQELFINGDTGYPAASRPAEVVYFGKTTDNTATELFLNGKGGAESVDGVTYYNRLYIPESTIVFGEYTYLQYNATDDVFGFERGYLCVANTNGTLAAVDVLNGDADAGDDVYTPVAIPESAGAANDGLTLGELPAGDIAFAVNDTTDYLELKVTGESAHTYYHKVYVRLFSLNDYEIKTLGYFGDQAAIPQFSE